MGELHSCYFMALSAHNLQSRNTDCSPRKFHFFLLCDFSFCFRRQMVFARFGSATRIKFKYPSWKPGATTNHPPNLRNLSATRFPGLRMQFSPEALKNILLLLISKMKSDHVGWSWNSSNFYPRKMHVRTSGPNTLSEIEKTWVIFQWTSVWVTERAGRRKSTRWKPNPTRVLILFHFLGYHMSRSFASPESNEPWT